MWKHLLAWAGMIPLAILNGALREGTYGRHMTELQAHQLSTLAGLALFALYVGAVMRWWPPASAQQAIRIGILWAALTLAFEFLFGHFVAGHSWVRLLQDYDLFSGRVWLLVPVFLAVAPYLFHRLLGR